MNSLLVNVVLLDIDPIYRTKEQRSRKAMTKRLQQLALDSFGRYPNRKLLEHTAYTDYNHLMRVYKEETGEKLHDFYTRKRIEFAIKLTRNTKGSADEIAMKCGYPHQSQLLRLIKIHTGKTFREVRDDAKGKLRDKPKDEAKNNQAREMV